MKKFAIVWRTLIAICVAHFTGAFLWLWSTIPYIENWYSNIFRCSLLGKTLFKFYFFDWCSVTVAIATVYIVYRDLAFEWYRLAKSFLVCVLSLGGGTSPCWLVIC